MQFESNDGASHNIASGKGDDYGTHHDHTEEGGVASGPFGPDEAYKIQFKQGGVYYFHDHLHSRIAVTVAVYDPSKN